MTTQTSADAPDRSAPILQMESVTKRYRKLVAVDDLSLRIEPGEFIGLIGPNGAGKSTMMGCISGTLAHDEGTVHVAGVDIADHPVDVRKHIGFVSQDLELYDYLTGREFLEFVADIRGMDRSEAEQRIEELLALTELTEAQNRLLREYSGGMSRKLAVSSALLGPPDLLLLDESFVGLDPESSFRIRRELDAFCQGGGAILLSSHSLEMIREICSRVVVLADGTLARDLTDEEIEEQIASGEFDNLTEIYLEATGKAPDYLD